MKICFVIAPLFLMANQCGPVAAPADDSPGKPAAKLYWVGDQALPLRWADIRIGIAGLAVQERSFFNIAQEYYEQGKPDPISLKNIPGLRVCNGKSVNWTANVEGGAGSASDTDEKFSFNVDINGTVNAPSSGCAIAVIRCQLKIVSGANHFGCSVDQEAA